MRVADFFCIAYCIVDFLVDIQLFCSEMQGLSRVPTLPKDEDEDVVASEVDDGASASGRHYLVGLSL